MRRRSIYYLMVMIALALSACKLPDDPAPTPTLYILPTLPEATLPAESTTPSPTFTLTPVTPTSTPVFSPTPSPTSPIPIATLSETRTPSPLPVITATPTYQLSACRYHSTFVEDISVPDDTILEPGIAFRKVWRLLNSGNCAWEEGTQLAFVDGDILGSSGRVTVESVGVGQMIDIGVTMIAPLEAGTYRSVWQLMGPDGELFGNRVYVQIVVEGPTPTPSGGSSDGGG